MSTGDWNHDGYADLAFSAPGASTPSGGVSVGRVYIYYGSATAQYPSGAVSVVEEDADQVLEGSEAGSRFGSALVTLDYNLDGIDDLCVGASSAGAFQLAYHGHISCFFGAATTGSPLSQQSALLGQCAASNGDCPYAFANLGAVLLAADINLDGQPDLVAGLPQAQLRSVGPQAGALVAFLASPANGAQTRYLDEADLQLYGSVANARFGAAAVLLDKSTLVVSEPLYSPDQGNKSPQVGRLHGFTLTGSPSSTLELFTVAGETPFGSLGSAVAAGSLTINGVNFANLLAVTAASIDTPRSGSQKEAGHEQYWEAGAVYLLNASSLLQISTPNTNLSWSAIQPPVVTLMGDSSGAAFGRALHLFDANGDAVNDLLVGQFRRDTASSPLTDQHVRRDAGALFAYLGGISAAPASSATVTIADPAAAASWCGGFPYQRAWFGEHLLPFSLTTRSSPFVLASARIDARFSERGGTIEVLSFLN